MHARSRACRDLSYLMIGERAGGQPDSAVQHLLPPLKLLLPPASPQSNIWVKQVFLFWNLLSAESNMSHQVVAAVDVNTTANDVYRHNFPNTPLLNKTIEVRDCCRWRRSFCTGDAAGHAGSGQEQPVRLSSSLSVTLTRLLWFSVQTRETAALTWLMSFLGNNTWRLQ